MMSPAEKELCTFFQNPTCRSKQQRYRTLQTEQAAALLELSFNYLPHTEKTLGLNISSLSITLVTSNNVRKLRVW